MCQENVIDLVLCGSSPMIWNASDWLKLRKDYRVVGSCIGCLAKKPRQNNMLGLPVTLMQEEAKLLLEKGVARLVYIKDLKLPPSDSLKGIFEKLRDQLYKEQAECLIDQRKLELDAVMDKIIEGKKRKIMGLRTDKKKLRKNLEQEAKNSLDTIAIDRDALMEKELAKLQKLEKNDVLVQTHTAYPWSRESAIQVSNWKYPCNEQEKFRYQVFKDLWNRGYYVTSGVKFGCDLLAYPGDPILFHSQLLIYCQDKYEEISIAELIAQCRTGTSVRKTTVFATMSKHPSVIEYTSIRWSDSSMTDT